MEVAVRDRAQPGEHRAMRVWAPQFRNDISVQNIHLIVLRKLVFEAWRLGKRERFAIWEFKIVPRLVR